MVLSVASMGRQSSNRPGEAPPVLQQDTGSQPKVDLSGHEEPGGDLVSQFICAILRAPTNPVIDKLGSGRVEDQAVSLDSLKEVTGSLIQLNEGYNQVLSIASMGGQSSNRPGEAPPVLEHDTDSQPKVDLSRYEAPGGLDADLQDFQNILQGWNDNVIINIGSEAEDRPVSFDSLTEVIGSLLEMNRVVVRVILDHKEDIATNQELLELVKVYLESSLRTIDFCRRLQKYINQARDCQVTLQIVEKEDVVDDKKDAGNRLMEDLIQDFLTFNKHQLSMLKELQLRRNKLDEKLKSVKAWRKVSSIIFASAFGAILIGSVVAAAMAAPTVAAALAAASSIPIGSMGKWFDSLWEGYANALKGQEEVISSMERGTHAAINYLGSSQVVVDRWEIEIRTLMENADFTLKEGEAVKIGVEEIEEKLGVFKKSIDDLSKQADICGQDIVRAKTFVLQTLSELNIK